MYFLSTAEHYVMDNCHHVIIACSEDTHDAEAEAVCLCLSLQFMQRGLDSQTKKQLEEEEKKIISEEHWYLDVPDLKEKE